MVRFPKNKENVFGALRMNLEEEEKVRANLLERPSEPNMGGVVKAWTYPQMIGPTG